MTSIAYGLYADLKAEKVENERVESPNAFHILHSTFSQRPHRRDPDFLAGRRVRACDYLGCGGVFFFGRESAFHEFRGGDARDVAREDVRGGCGCHGSRFFRQFAAV